MTRARYSAYMLEIPLDRKHTVGMELFTASPTDYMTKLRKRASMPNSLRFLIAELFKRKVIVDCRITYGTKMTLKLAKRSPKGHSLLLDGALRQFQEAFSDITGQKVDVNWEEVGSSSGRIGRRSRVDATKAVNLLAKAIDAVADGIVLAAAAKILSGDDD